MHLRSAFLTCAWDAKHLAAVDQMKPPNTSFTIAAQSGAVSSRFLAAEAAREPLRWVGWWRTICLTDVGTVDRIISLLL
jgi:hypothetical protein